MTVYKIKGIEEMMLYHFDMDASKFFEMNVMDLKNLLIIIMKIIHYRFLFFLMKNYKLEMKKR